MNDRWALVCPAWFTVLLHRPAVNDLLVTDFACEFFFFFFFATNTILVDYKGAALIKNINKKSYWPQLFEWL